MPSRKPKDKENRGPAPNRRGSHKSSPTRSRRRDRSQSPSLALQPHNSQSQEPHDGVSAERARIRELEALVATLKSQSQAGPVTPAGASPPRGISDTPPDDSIAPPGNLSEVTISNIQELLGMGPDGKSTSVYTRQRWFALRRNVRANLAAGRLQKGVSWKHQDTTKVARVYNAVAADFPEMKRFNNLWALAHIAHECWGNGNSYNRAVDDPDSYRSRRRRAPGHVQRRVSTPNHNSDDDDGDQGNSGDQGDPDDQEDGEEGPSNPAPHRAALRRIDSDLSALNGADDDLDLFSSDNEPPTPSGKGKRKAASASQPAQRKKARLSS
ncbi:hypothetical protein GGX14DRAFT_567980 [Mycena pura]|uniref:Uncharacterized protein n=1 Tax=Mycena pura TaxID=153505 RepID=A0AAD6V9Y4_9AGAR|nr:hypothetical protein GGX14DRAFT_567980 [Mycena pura]